MKRYLFSLLVLLLVGLTLAGFGDAGGRSRMRAGTQAQVSEATLESTGRGDRHAQFAPVLYRAGRGRPGTRK